MILRLRSCRDARRGSACGLVALVSSCWGWGAENSPVPAPSWVRPGSLRGGAAASPEFWAPGIALHKAQRVLCTSLKGVFSCPERGETPPPSPASGWG